MSTSAHHDDGELAGGVPSAPSTFQRFKTVYGPYIAEAIGAGVIIFFGAGAQLQTQLYGAGSPTSCHLGEWGKK